MYKPPNMNLWQGRIDGEEETPAWRWHQRIAAWNEQTNPAPATVLLGFACDEGVKRNKGRTGAKQGPTAMRRVLGNLAYGFERECFDAGDIVCEGSALESAQQELATQISTLLSQKHFPIVLGGGHEVAWGSFQGIAGFLEKFPQGKLGIINLDAHFDLRNPHSMSPREPATSSGTPFRQIAQWCESNQREFHYCVLGINPGANTQALFTYAREKGVHWREDWQCTPCHLTEMSGTLADFIAPLDYLYVTICLDVFNAASAPGVSAPSVAGIEPVIGVQLIKIIKAHCAAHNTHWLLADIAELNPELDIDNITAKLAARLIYEICVPEATAL